MDADVISL